MNPDAPLFTAAEANTDSERALVEMCQQLAAMHIDGGHFEDGQGAAKYVRGCTPNDAIRYGAFTVRGSQSFESWNVRRMGKTYDALSALVRVQDSPTAPQLKETLAKAALLARELIDAVEWISSSYEKERV